MLSLFHHHYHNTFRVNREDVGDHFPAGVAGSGKRDDVLKPFNANCRPQGRGYLRVNLHCLFKARTCLALCVSSRPHQSTLHLCPLDRLQLDQLK